MFTALRVQLLLLLLAAAAYSQGPCDINPDGSRTAADVAGIVSDALTGASLAHDLNADGAVNVLDIQTVIDWALGGSCGGAAPLNITGFNPSSGPVGTTVTITGVNFGAAPQVTMPKQGGGTLAQPVSGSTATSVTFVIAAGTASGAISLTIGNAAGATATAFTVTAATSFSVSASPGTANLIQGQSVSYAVQLSSGNGFNQVASLSVTGAPSGVTTSLTPQTITAGQTAVLTLKAPANQAVASTGLTITATATVDGIPATQSTPVTLSVVAPTTTFLGRTVVSDSAETPLAGITVTTLGQDGGGNTTGCTGHSTVSDAAGNFVLTGLPSSCIGPQMIGFDGTTATSPAGKYAGVNLVFTLVSGQVVVSPVLVHMPRIDNVETFLVHQNSNSDQTYSFQSIPGLQVTVYAGTTFTMQDGSKPDPFPLAAINVPVDRLPDQMPVTNSMVSAFIVAFQPANTTASKAVAVWFPNTLNTPPTTNMPLMTLDPTRGRMVAYGTGTVSNDGTTIIPDVDPSTGSLGHRYGIIHFDWHGPTPPGPGRNPGPGSKPDSGDGDDGGDGSGDGSGPGDGGNVDLASGLESFRHTDLALTGGLDGARIVRTYRSASTEVGAFGIGATHNFSIRLDNNTPQSAATVNLIMPDGNRIPFARQPNGTLVNAGNPNLVGAVLTTAQDGTAKLSFKDGKWFSFRTAAPYGAVLTGITDRTGGVTTLTYNSGTTQIKQITDASGRSINIAYDGAGRITSLTDPIGRQVLYTYDGSGHLATVTDPAGAVTRYTYNSAGDLATVTDPRGIVTYQDTYDANGRVIQQTQADGSVLKFAYTLTNALVPSSPVVATVETDARGNQSTYRFNTQGYLISVTDPTGAIRTFDRDAATNAITRMSGNGVCGSCGNTAAGTVSFTYDAFGNMTSMTDATGGVTHFTYETVFNTMLSMTDPLNHTVTFGRDAKANITSVTDAVGSVTRLTYSPTGLLLTMTDPTSQTVKFGYDASGNLVQFTDAAGNIFRASYDGAGRLVQYQDSMGELTTLAYDNVDRVTSVTDERGGKTTYGYDAMGNMVTITDPSQHTTAYQYDNRRRIVKRTDPLSHVETFAFDANGNLTQSVDRLGNTSTFTYDALNRLVTETYFDATVKHIFDASSRQVRIEDSQSGVYAFTYDAAGRVISAQSPLGTVNYTRDLNGFLHTRAVAGQSTQNYTLDASGRLTGVAMAPLSVTIGYDTRDLINSITRSNGVSTAYSYNSLGQLLSRIHKLGAAPINTQTFTYDPVGRKTTEQSDIAQPLVTQAATNNTYDAGNRLTAFGARSYTQDANGNRLSDTGPEGTTTYTWNGRGQLATITTPSGQTITLTYDYAGNLVRRAASGDVTWSYVLDEASNVVYQYSSAGDQISFLTGLGLDSYFASVDGHGNVSYPMIGGVGNTVGVTDSSGALIGKTFYEPYGQTTSTGAAYPFQFASRNSISGTLYYFRHRYYDSLSSRFLSEDPIGYIGGGNLYQYAFNNPVNNADPTGLWAGWDDVLAIAGGALKGVGGQVLGDLVQGKLSSWEDYAGAAIGGAVEGETLLYTANPLAAELAGAAAGNLATQGLKIAAGDQPCGFDATDFIAATGAGLIGHELGDIEVKIPGINKGRNSWLAKGKSAVTKIMNGNERLFMVSKARAKGVAGYAVDKLAGPALEAKRDEIIEDSIKAAAGGEAKCK